MLSTLALIFISGLSRADDLTMSDFLNVAWQRGPVIKGEALQNEASESFVSSVRGKYLPQLSLAAIDSTGFAASNGELGVGGLMGSPFRSGAAGGVIVTQNIYDFGKIDSVLEQAKAERVLARARLSEDKYKFLLSMGQIYLACARSKSSQETDERLMDWAKVNLRETAKYTRTGQRSIVDNALVQAEVDDLHLELDQLHLIEQSLKDQMKLFAATTGCRDLDGSWQTSIAKELQVEEPSVLLAKAQIESAQASYDGARADQLPTLKAMGSAGLMDQARLVERQDYSGGVGIVFPVWNGGEDARREQAYKSQSEYQKENLKAAELDYSARIKNLKDLNSRDRQALSVLNADLEKLRKTMRLATQRYRNLQGPLIDVREAFKQLRAVELQRIEVLYALGGSDLRLGILGLQ